MEISAQHLKEIIVTSKNVHILDVREEWEFDEGHIKGACNFSLYNIPVMNDKIKDWKEKEIIIYCKTGVRGKKAQILLSQLGFKNTKNLIGGYEAFLNQD